MDQTKSMSLAQATEKALQQALHEQPSINTSSSSKHIFETDDISITLSIAVTRYDIWKAQQYAYERDGGALEVNITKLDRSLHSYAHGGFMGLATTVHGDAEWMSILKNEDSSAYTAFQQQALKLKLIGKATKPSSSQGKYMTCLENSPILVAYGLIRSGCTTPVAVQDNNTTTSIDTTTAVISTKTATRTTTSSSRVILEAPPSQTMTDNNSNNNNKYVKSNALIEYQQSMHTPNRYGYLPIANEWDLWINPHSPSSLTDATILHGTPAALVSQAITSSIPGLKSCAKRAGLNLIITQGLSPIEWLTQVGNAINIVVNGDDSMPLELYGTEEVFWKLSIELESVRGYDGEKWEGVYVQGQIDSMESVFPVVRSAVAMEEDRVGGIARWRGMMSSVDDDDDDTTIDDTTIDDTTSSSSNPLSATMNTISTTTINIATTAKTAITKSLLKRAETSTLSFWPLNIDDLDQMIVLSLRGDPVGIYKDRAIASTSIRLGDILDKYPEIVVVDSDNKKVMNGVVMEIPLDAVYHKTATTNTTVTAPHDGDIEMTPPTTTTTNTTKPSNITLKIKLSMTPISVIDAAVSMGIPRSAAQTAIAMLSSPGGLYLDIKSAYSSAKDIQLFVTAMRGIGLTCKAVCSFKPEQLMVGNTSNTVLFFHGLSGVENACDAGRLHSGQFVLFNGASFLQELSHTEINAMTADDACIMLSTARSWPLNKLAVRKYLSLCEQYHIVGGIYVQEPDSAPSCIDALCALVNQYPDAFPLGFAYGHCAGKAATFFDSKGRGFASQQILEEMASRKDLSGRTITKIKAGQHRGASLDTLVVWSARLLHGYSWMNRNEQRAFCVLLTEVKPDSDVDTLLHDVGGIELVIARFHDHYELTTPLTLLEAGFNYNFSKSVIRIMRNRGVYARMSIKEKIELAQFMCSGRMRGYGLTYLLQTMKIRKGLHKHAKEGLLCILESCTAEEVVAVVDALGGENAVRLLLRGRMRLSWHYTLRWRDITMIHEKDPQSLAYTDTSLKYASIMHDDAFDVEKELTYLTATHTRDKTSGEQVFRGMRKSFCCGFTLSYSLFLEIITVGTFLPCCVLPRACGIALKGTCGVPAVFSFIVGFIIAAVFIIVYLVVRNSRQQHGDDD